ncbi:MAG: metallophosphoesterase family protein [Candidatus Gastranaerophilales bacterium]|nr:metallophosphoesterase family protein [Candidatus Gastranaerophilales bacterium]
MKIAVISDIHGNMEALTSVLDKIKALKCDKIFCLGDLAMAGPEPNKAVSFIKELSCKMGENFQIIQGNTDKMLCQYSPEIYEKLSAANQIMANAYVADSQELSAENKEYLNSLNVNNEITLNGIKILLVHGSPRRNDENIFPDLKIAQVEEIVKDANADLIFCGHTHMPCGYQTNTNVTVVNVGSVGRPFSEVPQSCFAVLDIDEINSTYTILHDFVDYDFKLAGEKLINRGFEGVEKLAQMLAHATSRYPE